MSLPLSPQRLDLFCSFLLQVVCVSLCRNWVPGPSSNVCVWVGGCPCTDNQPSDASWCRDPTPSLGSPPGVSGGALGEGAQSTSDINTYPSDGPATSWTSLRPPPTQGRNPGCLLHSEHLVVSRGSLSWILFISKATNKT